MIKQINLFTKQQTIQLRKEEKKLETITLILQRKLNISESILNWDSKTRELIKERRI
jgi:hypothetical protein